MNEEDFKEAYRSAMHTDTEARRGKATLQSEVRKALDSGAIGHVAHWVAHWLGDLKTEFEQDIARETKESKAAKRKVFQARIADINRTCKKDYGHFFRPINRPRGDKAHTERWNYECVEYEPKEKPEVSEVTGRTTILGPHDAVINKARQALLEAVYESVTTSAETAVDAVVNYHSLEDIGREVARRLQAKETEDV